MLSYGLAYEPHYRFDDSGGGLIPSGAEGTDPRWQTALGGSLMNLDTNNIESSAISVGAGLVDTVLPGVGSLLGGVASAIGIGPDDWSVVDAKFRGQATKIKAYFQDRLSKVKTANDLTELDRELTAYVDEAFINSTKFKSYNSRKGHELLYNLLSAYQNGVRTSIKNRFLDVRMTPKTEALGKYNYQNILGWKIFTDSGATYMVYSVKGNISVKPVQTSLPNSNNYTVPTDSDYLETDKDKINWLYLLIVPIVAGVYYGGKWLYKKLKK